MTNPFQAPERDQAAEPARKGIVGRFGMALQLGFVVLFALVIYVPQIVELYKIDNPVIMLTAIAGLGFCTAVFLQELTVWTCGRGQLLALVTIFYCEIFLLSPYAGDDPLGQNIDGAVSLTAISMLALTGGQIVAYLIRKKFSG